MICESCKPVCGGAACAQQVRGAPRPGGGQRRARACAAVLAASTLPRAWMQPGPQCQRAPVRTASTPFLSPRAGAVSDRRGAQRGRAAVLRVLPVHGGVVLGRHGAAGRACGATGWEPEACGGPWVQEAPARFVTALQSLGKVAWQAVDASRRVYDRLVGCMTDVSWACRGAPGAGQRPRRQGHRQGGAHQP